MADVYGRRLSFLLGTVTLAITTALYVLLWQVEAAFWLWAVVSLLLGLGFTFFSGATEAWLVDALRATGFVGALEPVFARAQVITGIGMLTGSVAGGYIAQATNLGVPFVLRAIILAVMFAVALAFMRDIGFKPAPRGHPIAEMRSITADSIEYGWRVPQVRYLMLAAPFTGGVGIYVFYALQPYLLELYGDPEAYGIAGLVAAIVAGAQIVGGLVAPALGSRFRRRTSALVAAEVISVITLALIGLIESFGAVIALIVVWGLLFAASMPIRQAYLNGPHPLPAAGDDPVVRLPDVVERRRGRAADPRPGRRRLGLPRLLPPVERDLGALAAVPGARAAPRAAVRAAGAAARGRSGARRQVIAAHRARPAPPASGRRPSRADAPGRRRRRASRSR